MRMDEIDFEIHGDDSQFVEIELDPGEAAIGEAGAMMFIEDGIEMDTVFGDTAQSGAQAGFMDKLVSAGKRLITGEGLFTTVFHNESQMKRKIAFAAPHPGKIIAIDLAAYGHQFICQKDAFLCAARGVSLDIAFQRKIGAGLFGAEGFIMQRLVGDGLAFVHAGGMLTERTLGEGEVLRIDTGMLVGVEPTVDYDIQYVGSLKTAMFGGEGLFLGVLKGPGRVWLQSMPISRLAGRIMNYAPENGGSRGEGSVLGSVGNLLNR